MVTDSNAVQSQPQVMTQSVVTQPMQQIVVIKQEKPYPGFLENKPLMILILLGAVFLLVGAIMVNIAPEITNKDYRNASTDLQYSDQRAQKAMTDFGTVMKSIGIFFIFAFLLLAVVLRNDWSDYTRFGILLLIALVMFGSRFTIP